MASIFKVGQTIGNLKVEKLLGAGGQGEVYQVLEKDTNKKYALKWYFKNQATPEQEQNILNLTLKYTPGDEFLWPSKLIKENTTQGFGYLMAIRPNDYSSLNDLMKRKAEPSFRILIMAAYRLVQGFHWLHRNGLCYRDISFGNAFFKVATGEVLICDNDNVAPASLDNTSGINGTPRFMAPEIVRGEANASASTDLFSLAVLLHYFFYLGHPLDGQKEAEIKCFDLPAMKRLYGENPIYIFHPEDSSNRPVRGLHDNPIAYKNIYPESFQLLFQKAFVDGLMPNKRVQIGEWRDGLISLLGSLNACEKCGAHNFGKDGKCWHCKHTLPNRPILKTSAGHNILLHRNTVGYAEYFTSNQTVPFSVKYFELNQHPRDTSKWGIKNLTKDTWTATQPDGSVSNIPPDKSILLRTGLKVQLGFGAHSFEVLA